MNEYLNNKKFESLIVFFQNSKKDIKRNKIIISEIKETIERNKKRKINQSLKKKELKDRISSTEQIINDHEQFKQKLASALLTLSENIVRYAKFQLIDADDAIQEGVMICFDKMDRFDPRKGKAFNYMTTCILNHFRQLYRTARNYNELKKKYLNHIQIEDGGSQFKNGKQVFDPNSHH